MYSMDKLTQKFMLLGLSDTMANIVVLAGMYALIGLVSFISLYIAKRWVLRFFKRLSTEADLVWLNTAFKHRVFYRTLHLIPAIILYSTAHLVALTNLPFSADLTELVSIAATIYMIVIGAMVFTSLLNAFEERYQDFKIAKQRPIKSYMQILKIFLYVFTGIFIISTLMNRSPMYFITGLGAMTAVTMLVFKDSILGFVASIQLAANDMVRIGDWIEVPNYGADGDVKDISLNTIKVQNFDKTIVTIPSYALLTNGVKNWRGMKESGGRRIKRSVFIDVNTIKFCDDDLLLRLKKFDLLTEVIDSKVKEIDDHNQRSNANKDLVANGRHLTNLGLFRSYLESYLGNHPKIHKGFTFLIRQLQDTGKGLPVELYIFTTDTNWNRHEEIQADIFDHIYAVMPYFDLKVFQFLSGSQAKLAVDSSAVQLNPA